MSESTSRLRNYGLVSMVVLLLLLSLASGVWAQPSQSGLRMTVPTRTPTKAAVVVEPTAEPAQPTATPKKKKSNPQPTQVPTEQAIVADPTAAPTEQAVVADPTAAPTEQAMVVDPAEATPAVVAPAATETAAVLIEVGYPESGADQTNLLLSAGTLGLIVISAVVIAVRRRASSAN